MLTVVNKRDDRGLLTVDTLPMADHEMHELQEQADLGTQLIVVYFSVQTLVDQTLNMLTVGCKTVTVGQIAQRCSVRISPPWGNFHPRIGRRAIFWDFLLEILKENRNPTPSFLGGGRGISPRKNRKILALQRCTCN